MAGEPNGHPLVIWTKGVKLPAPTKEYLNLSELAEWLVVSESTVRRLIAKGTLPNGKTRPDGKRLYWTRLAAAVCKWVIDNLDQFQGASGESRDGPE